MVEFHAIVEDLNRCVGCYACEVACRKRNKFPEGESSIRVRQIGPDLVNGKLSMDYVVSIGQGCTLCLFCVSICPTKALVYCHAEQKLLEHLKKGRVQVVNLG